MQSTLDNWKTLFLIGVLVPFISVSGFALMQFDTTDVPVDRLAENGKRYIQKHPDDPQGYYALGRVYSLAFGQQTHRLHGVTDNQSDRPAIDQDIFHGSFFPGRPNYQPDWMRTYFSELSLQPGPADPSLSSGRKTEIDQLIEQLGHRNVQQRNQARKRLTHLDWNAVPYLKTALEQDDLSEEQKHHLKNVIDLIETVRFTFPAISRDVELPEGVDPTLRSKMEENKKILSYFHNAVYYYRKAITVSEDEPDPKTVLGLAWTMEVAGKPQMACSVYIRAFHLTIENDLRKQDWPNLRNRWHGSIALEAGQRLLKITEREDLSVPNRSEIERKTNRLRTNYRASANAITPIIVPLTETTQYDEIIDNRTSVSFDMDGNGVTRLWTWITPDAGLLVWDPDHQKDITSGRQLFGNVTWWVFWDHGFQPMTYMDDDGDGWLSGKELNGLAIWRDLNRNGRSESREVKSVSEWGIRKLNVHMDKTVEGVPVARRGVIFSDGAERPLFDWVPKHVPDSAGNE